MNPRLPYLEPVWRDSHWKLDGPGCVAESGDGWIRLEGVAVGALAISQQWQGTPCP
jgi:hypothetical protein